jgi:hypothetical protein
MSSTNQPTLPAEISLTLLPHIPYHPTTWLNLHLTSRTIHDLLNNHEKSLVRAITALQFPPSALQLFPGLDPVRTYSDLNKLWSRLRTLDELNKYWLHVVTNTDEFHWLEGRWSSVHKAGLLLLYRLQDASSYQAKLELLKSLPPTSLACLLFKLVSSIRILRVFGPEPIHLRYALGRTEERSEVEVATEEMILRCGPEFFVALLREDGVWKGWREVAVRYVLFTLSQSFAELSD